MTDAGGQWRHAVKRRLQKAAERQGGGAVAEEVRVENARVRARKRRSDVEGVVEIRVPESGGTKGLDSMSGTRLRGGIIAYKRLMKSLRSMSSASPGRMPGIG